MIDTLVEIVRAAASLGLTWAAVQAYRTARKWKEEIQVRAEHDCARKLLGAVYRVESIMQAVRAPMSQHPMEEDYAKRLTELDRALTEMWEAGGPARVLWGSEGAGDILQPMQRCYAELRVGIEEFLYLKSLGDLEGEQAKRFNELHRIVFTVYSDDDEFTAKVTGFVAKAEAFLRPKISLS